MNTYYNMFPTGRRNSRATAHAIGWTGALLRYPDLSPFGNFLPLLDMGACLGFRTWELGCVVGSADECFDGFGSCSEAIVRTKFQYRR